MTPLTLPRKPHPVESLDHSDLVALAEWLYENDLVFDAKDIFDLLRNPRQYADEFERWQDWLRDTDPWR